MSARRASSRQTAAEREYVASRERVLARYGVTAERRRVDVPVLDGTADVLVSGEGPPVVLVIGGGPPAGAWIPLLAELPGLSLHVLELPGMGLTTRVPYSSHGLRRLAVDYLEQTVAALGLSRPMFVAQSIGGMWTTWLGLDRPERVAAAALIGCPAGLLGTSAPWPLRLTTLPGVGALARRLDRPSPRQVVRFAALAGEDLTGQPELADLFLAHERLSGWGPALADLVDAVVRVRGVRPEVTTTEAELARLEPPVHFVWGDHDPFGPAEVGRRAARIIPGARCDVVPGGHAPWLGDPGRVAALVGPFLRAHADRSAPRPA